MAQVRFQSSGSPALQISLTDTADHVLLGRVTGLTSTSEIRTTSILTLSREVIASSALVENFETGASFHLEPTAIEFNLNDALGQILVLTIANSDNHQTKYDIAIPSQPSPDIAPPELDPLLTTMIEDDHIIIKDQQFFTTECQANGNGHFVPLPNQLAKQAADVLALYGGQEEEEGFILFDSKAFS